MKDTTGVEELEETLWNRDLSIESDQDKVELANGGEYIKRLHIIM